MVANYVKDNAPYNVVTFDLARPFDKVPHSLLVDTLSINNLRQTSLCWLKSCITRCNVHVSDEISQEQKVKAGIIQNTAFGTVTV